MANNNNGYLKQEPDEFQRKYKVSSWWLRNKETLRKIGIGLFIAFDTILIGFVLWTFIDTYLVSYQEEQGAVVGMISQGQQDIRSYSQAHAAEPVDTDEPRSFFVQDNRYNVYTTIENPNTEWYATFEYSFNYNGEETDRIPGFVLPGEERPLAILGVESDSTPRGLEINLHNFEWHRVDRQAVGEYEEWKEDHLDFIIEDATFTSDIEVDGERIGRSSFTVTNNTAYSYFEPTFYILLQRGGSVVGVNRAVVSGLEPGEERQVRVNWFGTLPAVTQVEVIPAINIFDEDAYRELGR